MKTNQMKLIKFQDKCLIVCVSHINSLTNTFLSGLCCIQSLLGFKLRLLSVNKYLNKMENVKSH